MGLERRRCESDAVIAASHSDLFPVPSCSLVREFGGWKPAKSRIPVNALPSLPNTLIYKPRKHAVSIPHPSHDPHSLIHMPGIKDAKCVLVLGATSGIGRALALAIHDLDTAPTVILAGRRQERLDELAKQGERIETARVDINTSENELKGFVQETLSKFPEVRWLS